MRRRTARRVSTVLTKFGDDMVKILVLIRKYETPADFRRYQKTTALLLQVSLTEILNRVYIEHPT